MTHVVSVAYHIIRISALDTNIVTDIADMGQVRRYTVSTLSRMVKGGNFSWVIFDRRCFRASKRHILALFT